MKIGILTFHSALNVGAVLQAYCLQEYLLRSGCEVEFIDYQPTKERLSLRNFVGRGLGQTFQKWEDLYYTFYYQQNGRFNRVLNCGQTRYRTHVELKSNPPKCELYIAGSDQIWNFGFSRRFDEAYFLEFGDYEVKRIAFAASIGQNVIPDELREIFSENLKRFDRISVREKSSVKLISELANEGQEVEQICDPTFLLSKSQFQVIEEAPEVDEQFVVSYILPHYEMGQDLIDAVHFVKNTFSSPLINLRNPNTCQRLGRSFDKVVTPQRWLGYFKNAKFTICCSFHAVVFSLICHRNFIVISPYENNRILSLLDEVGLSERCVYAFDRKKIENIIGAEINWATVDTYFARERERSVQFLQEAIVVS